MGYTGYRSTKPTYDALKNLITSDNFLASGYEVVDYSIAATGEAHLDPNGWSYHAFLAVRDTAKDDVFCLVVLGMKHDGWFCYKDVPENALPAHEGVSVKVLDALTPTENAVANEWRERARHDIAYRRARRKLIRRAQRTGEPVSLTRPLTYQHIGTVTDVIIVNSKLWITPDGQQLRAAGKKFIAVPDELLAA